MSTKGIVLAKPDNTIEAQARGHGLPVQVDPALPLAFDKTLFVAPGTRVPWDLLPAAWHFLERWDAAVPLWRYGKTANQVGTKEERQRTADIIRDLRVLLHSVELLFVRDNADGQALLSAYRQELDGGNGAGDGTRLAFLRAYYQVKPRLCVLPVTWLAEVAQRARQDAKVGRGRPRQHGALISLEVLPGVWIKCHEGQEEEMRARYQAMAGRRR